MLYIVGKDTYSHDRQRILPQQELEMDMVSLIVLYDPFSNIHQSKLLS